MARLYDSGLMVWGLGCLQGSSFGAQGLCCRGLFAIRRMGSRFGFHGGRTLPSIWNPTWHHPQQDNARYGAPFWGCMSGWVKAGSTGARIQAAHPKMVV